MLEIRTKLFVIYGLYILQSSNRTLTFLQTYLMKAYAPNIVEKM